MDREDDASSDDSLDSFSSDDYEAPPPKSSSGAMYPDDSAIFMEASRSELKLDIPRSQSPEGADVAFPTSAASPIAEQSETSHVPSTPVSQKRPRAQSQAFEPQPSHRPRSISQVPHEKPLPPPPHTAPLTGEGQTGKAGHLTVSSSTSNLKSAHSSSMGESARRLILSLTPSGDNGGSSSRRSEHRRSFTVDRRPMVVAPTSDAIEHQMYRATSTPARDRVPPRTSTMPTSSPSSFHPPPSLVRLPRSAARMAIMPPSTPTEPPVLLRTLPKPPLNPREHRLLERIYNEMHADRFINLAPLPLLSNWINNYFKSTCFPMSFLVSANQDSM